jgi:hypothetical protein
LYLVDWEAFGRDYVAWDLRNVIPLMPDAVERLLDRVSGIGVAARAQMRVVTAMLLILHERHRDVIVQRHRGFQIRRASAAARYEEKRQSYLHLLRLL